MADPRRISFGGQVVEQCFRAAASTPTRQARRSSSRPAAGRFDAVLLQNAWNVLPTTEFGSVSGLTPEDCATGLGQATHCLAQSATRGPRRVPHGGRRELAMTTLDGPLVVAPVTAPIHDWRAPKGCRGDERLRSRSGYRHLVQATDRSDGVVGRQRSHHSAGGLLRQGRRFRLLARGRAAGGKLGLRAHRRVVPTKSCTAFTQRRRSSSCRVPWRVSGLVCLSLCSTPIAWSRVRSRRTSKLLVGCVAHRSGFRVPAAQSCCSPWCDATDLAD